MNGEKTYGKDEQAYQLIKEKILTLEFPPKHPLREIELSQMLSMSRTPVRSAISRLISEGFVDEIGPKQNIVSDISLESFRNIYQIRECLEELCVSLAVFAWQDLKELKPARALIEKQAAIAQGPLVDSRAFLLADRDFHCALATLSRNSLLRDEMMRVYDLYWRYNFYSMYANRANQVVVEHRDILNCIENRDRAQVLRYTREHLSETKEEILIGIAQGFEPAQELPHAKRGYILPDTKCIPSAENRNH